MGASEQLAYSEMPAGCCRRSAVFDGGGSGGHNERGKKDLMVGCCQSSLSFVDGEDVQQCSTTAAYSLSKVTDLGLIARTRADACPKIQTHWVKEKHWTKTCGY